jgi:hypothetical protein
MVAGVGEVAAVVMATGYVVVLAGRMQVASPLQLAEGAVVAVIEDVLPFVTNVPVSGNVCEPSVNVVAEVVTCQPARQDREDKLPDMHHWPPATRTLAPRRCGRSNCRAAAIT